MSEYDELLPAFIEESQQHLQSIEPDILALEQGGATIDRDVVNRIFRGVHSIKGASGFFGLQNIGALSHVIENSLSLLRDGKITPSSELIDALLRSVDTLKAMIDDVGGSEQMDIRQELDLLQKLLDNTSNPQRTVTVAEKKTDRKDTEISKFNVSENDIKQLLSKGLHLYAVKIFLDKDLRQKNKSPYDFIYNMESLGQYVDSFLDIQSVSGLSDCLDNDLAFDFLFATKLEPDLVPEGLGLPDDRVVILDLNGFSKEKSVISGSSSVVSGSLSVVSGPLSVVSGPSSVVSGPLSVVSGPSSVARENGQRTTDNGQRTTDNGQRTTDNGQRTTDNGQRTTDNGQRTTDNGQRTTDNGQQITDKSVRQVQTEEKIRVGVNFLNDLVNLAGELVLGRNQLMQTALPLVKNTPGLNPVLQHISRVTSEMQEKIMQMRMQPISLIFGKFHRIVRTLARSHDKEVRLITYGEDVELDKSIIEGISDPLTHLIRNSVDHGIEHPDEREKLGKPRHGTIELKAYHQGGQVHLVVTDDGKGVDGKSVARKALEKGVIRQDQLNAMSEKDRVRLIFRPGFSTAEQITDLSGRGVGMDVVITNIEHLGGTVDIETKINKGSKMTLVLPLTLAIVSGLLIKAENQFFILPENDIDELVRVKPDEIKNRINTVQDAHVLRLRDTLLPLVDLNEALGLSESVVGGQLSVVDGQLSVGQLSVAGGPLSVAGGPLSVAGGPLSVAGGPLSVAGGPLSVAGDHGQQTTDNGQQTTDNGQQTTDNGQPTTDNGPPTTDHRQRTTDKPLRILVVKHGTSRFGLIVDSIESTEEIVVKPLPRYLKKMKSFSGVSILGNGKVSLILDVAGILKKAAIRHLEETKEEMKTDSDEITVEAEVQTFLLFDNNTPERFAVPLELISRIERVPASKIEYVKDNQFLQYHDKKLRLIFLEDYLPVRKPERSSEDTVGLIVPKQTKHPLGIVMSRVINTLNAVIELDTTTIMAPGLFGSAVLDGKITLLPDMYRLFELAAPEWYTTEKAKKGTCSLERCRILLAEDTPFFRMVERDYLTSAGYDVIVAEDGRKAMRILEEEIVDAVILDIVMPRMDGWETIRAIRSDERLKDLPVMAVTSLGEGKLAEEGLRAGFTEWELKLNKTRLLEKLADMLS
ncbi:chemotaxis protein CheW [Desulfobacterales bacterium HSG2]|nr:chemotaxis protein CheW [Desulfobacterales bacterium HSG2]